MIEESYVSVTVAARLLGVNPRTVRRWLDCGVLGGRRMGGPRGWRQVKLISVQTLRRAEARLAEGASAAPGA